MKLLRFGAIFAVTILITAICVQVVEKAYSETEDLVTPYSGEDYYVPYGSVSSIDGETVYVTGDMIVEGTLYINESYIVMASVSESVVNRIIVRPWGHLFINDTEILTGFIDRPYEIVLYGETEIRNSTIRNLHGQEISGTKIGGVQIFTDNVILDNSTIQDSRGGPAVSIYKCSPLLKFNKIINCSLGISFDLDNTGTNTPPSASISINPTTYSTGATISFDGSDSSDSDGTIVFYKWDFGNGNVSSVVDPDIEYAKAGKYIVTLTVYDDNGAFSTVDKLLTITNQLPSANAGPDLNGYLDEPVRFDGSLSTDNDGYIINYTWTIGQDTVYGIDPVYTFDSQNPNPKTVTLTVKDDDGDTDSDNVQVTILTKPSGMDWPFYMKTNENQPGITDLPPALWEYSWKTYVGDVPDDVNGLILANGQIYAGASSNLVFNKKYSFVAIDPTTGAITDSTGLDHPVTFAANYPADGTNTVFFLDNNNQLFRRDADDLSNTSNPPYWSYPGPSTYKAEAPVVSFPVHIGENDVPMVSYIESFDDPVPNNDDLYRVNIFEASDGTDYWVFEIYEKGYAPLESIPAVHLDSYVFGITLDVNGIQKSKLYCLDLVAKESWSRLIDSEHLSTPTIYNDNIIFGDGNGIVYSVSLDNEDVWSFQTGSSIMTAPVIQAGTPDKIIVSTEDGQLFGLDESDGTLLWYHDLGHPVTITPLVMDEYVLVLDDDGGATLIDASDDSDIKVVLTGGTGFRLSGQPIYVNGNIYLRDESGYIYCIDPASQSLNGAASDPYPLPPPIIEPDLTVEPMDIRFKSSNPAAGESFDVIVRVRNLGETASGEFDVELLRISPEPVQPLSTILDMTVGAEGYTIGTFSGISLPSSGEYTLKVVLDTGLDVTEACETNNENTKDISIKQNQFDPGVHNFTIELCELGIISMTSNVLLDNIILTI